MLMRWAAGTGRQPPLAGEARPTRWLTLWLGALWLCARSFNRLGPALTARGRGRGCSAAFGEAAVPRARWLHRAKLRRCCLGGAGWREFGAHATRRIVRCAWKLAAPATVRRLGRASRCVHAVRQPSSADLLLSGSDSLDQCAESVGTAAVQWAHAVRPRARRHPSLPHCRPRSSASAAAAARSHASTAARKAGSAWAACRHAETECSSPPALSRGRASKGAGQESTRRSQVPARGSSHQGLSPPEPISIASRARTCTAASSWASVA